MVEGEAETRISSLWTEQKVAVRGGSRGVVAAPLATSTTAHECALLKRVPPKGHSELEGSADARRSMRAGRASPG